MNPAFRRGYGYLTNCISCKLSYLFYKLTVCFQTEFLDVGIHSALEIKHTLLITNDSWLSNTCQMKTSNYLQYINLHKTALKRLFIISGIK